MHTILAYVDMSLDLHATIPVENANSLCALADRNATCVYNYVDRT